MKIFTGFVAFCSKPRNYVLLIAAIMALVFLPDFIPFPYGPFAFKAHTNGLPMIDMQINYTPVNAYRLIEGYGSGGRSYYIMQALTLDTVVPFCMAMFFCATFYLIFKKMKILNLFFIIPVAGMLCDYTENICVIIMIINRPKQLFTVAAICNVFSLCKSGLGTVCFVVLLIGLVLKAAQYLKKRNYRNEPPKC